MLQPDRPSSDRALLSGGGFAPPETNFSFGGAIDQFVKGFVQGYTTLEFGRDPRNSAEEISRSIGQVAGFLGFIPGPGLLGRIGGTAIARGFGASAAASKMAGAPLFMGVKSIPFLVGDKVVDAAASVAQRSAAASAVGFLQKGAVRDAIYEGSRLGMASGLSAWQYGVDEMLSSAGLGVVEGVGFGVFNHKIAKAFSAGGQRRAGAEALVRGVANSLYSGLPMSLGVYGEVPTEIEVYHYLLGGLFGVMDQPYQQKRAAEFMRGKHELELLSIHRDAGFEQLEPEVQREVLHQRDLLVGTRLPKVLNGEIEATQASAYMAKAYTEMLEERYRAAVEAGKSHEDAIQEAYTAGGDNLWARQQAHRWGAMTEEVAAELRTGLQGFEIHFGPTPSGSADRAAYIDYKTQRIHVDPTILRRQYKAQAWKKPKVEGVEPIEDGLVENYRDWEDFVLLHEYYHRVRGRRTEESAAGFGQSKADEENTINGLAAAKLREIKARRQGTARQKAPPPSPYADYVSGGYQAGSREVRFSMPTREGEDLLPVRVPMERLDELWRRDEGEYIADGAEAKEGSRQGFLAFLLKGEPVEMAELRMVKDGAGEEQLRFDNGRHRTAVLREMGIEHVEVAIPRRQLGAFREALGAEPIRPPAKPRPPRPEATRPRRKGGFSSKGRGSAGGDAKDRAMRKVASRAIVELAHERPSSSRTTMEQLGLYEGDGGVVMLARNGELRGQPLREDTAAAIRQAHADGARFVVGDMPGVDEPFVELLHELGARYTVYHAGDRPRFNLPEPGPSVAAEPRAAYDPSADTPEGDRPLESDSERRVSALMREHDLRQRAIADHEVASVLHRPLESFLDAMVAMDPTLGEVDRIELLESVYAAFSKGHQAFIRSQGSTRLAWHATLDALASRHGIELPADGAGLEGPAREAWRDLRRAWKIDQQTKLARQAYFDLASGKIKPYGQFDAVGNDIRRAQAPTHLERVLSHLGIETFSVERVEGVDPKGRPFVAPLHDHPSFELRRYLFESDQANTPVLFGTKDKGRLHHSRGYLYDKSQAPRLAADIATDINRAVLQLEMEGHLQKGEVSLSPMDELLEDFLKLYQDWIFDGKVTEEQVVGLYERLWVNNIRVLEALNGGQIPYAQMVYDHYSGRGQFILSAVGVNKRAQLFDDGAPTADVAMQPLRVQTQGGWRAAVVRAKGTRTEGRGLIEMDRWGLDEKGRKKIETYVAEHHLDGVVFMEQEAFDALLADGGLDAGAGVIKASTVFSTDDEGMFLGKQAIFRAPEGMQPELRRLGLDQLYFDTAAKQRGRRSLYDLYVKRDGSMQLENPATTRRRAVEKTLKPFTVPIEALRMNLSVGEDLRSAMKDQRLARQLGTNLKDPAAIRRYLEQHLLPSYYGAPEMNSRFYEYLWKRDEALLEELDVDELGLKEVLEVLTQPESEHLVDSALYQKVVRQIIGKTDLVSADELDTDEARDVLDALQRFTSASDRLLSTWALTPATVNVELNAPYFEQILRNYLTTRLLSPKAKYSGKAVLYPNDPYLRLGQGDRLHGDVEPGYFYLGEAWRTKPVRWLSGAEVTLEEAFNQYKAARAAGQVTREMQDLLRFAVIRVPADSISGTRMLAFGGFTGRQGAGLVVHNEEMAMLGGADLDIDSAFFYQDIDRGRGEDGRQAIAEHVAKHRDQWLDKQALKRGRRVILESKNEDETFVRTMGAHEKHAAAAADPRLLMLSSEGAYRGNRMLGVAANAGRRILAWLAQALSRRREEREDATIQNVGKRKAKDLLTGLHTLGVELPRDTVGLYFELIPDPELGLFERLRRAAMNYAADAGDYGGFKLNPMSLSGVLYRAAVKDYKVFAQTKRGRPAELKLSPRARAWLDEQGAVSPARTPAGRALRDMDYLGNGRNYDAGGERFTLWQTLDGLAELSTGRRQGRRSSRRPMIPADVANVHYQALRLLGETPYRDRSSGVDYVSFEGLARIARAAVRIWGEDTEEARLTRQVTGRDELRLPQLEEGQRLAPWALKQDLADITSAAVVHEALQRALRQGATLERLRQITQAVEEIKVRYGAAHRREKGGEQAHRQGELETMDDVLQESRQLAEALSPAEKIFHDAYLIGSLFRQDVRLDTLRQRVYRQARAEEWSRRELRQAIDEVTREYWKTNLHKLGFTLAWVDPAAVRSFGAAFNDLAAASMRELSDDEMRTLLRRSRMGARHEDLDAAEAGHSETITQTEDVERFGDTFIENLFALSDQADALELSPDQQQEMRRLVDELKTLLHRYPQLRTHYSQLFAGTVSEMRTSQGGIGMVPTQATLQGLRDFLAFFQQAGDFARAQAAGDGRHRVRWWHYFVFPDTIGKEHLASDAQPVRALRKVINARGEAVAQPVRIFDSTAGQVAELQTLVIEQKDGMVRELEKRLQDSFRFVGGAAPEEGRALVEAAVARMEYEAVRRDPRRRRLLEVYEKEYAPHRTTIEALRQKSYIINEKVDDGTPEGGMRRRRLSGGELLRRIELEVEGYLQDHYQTWIRNTAGENAWFVRREGQLDVEATLDKIERHRTRTGEIPNLGLDGFYRLVYELKLRQVQHRFRVGEFDEAMGHKPGTTGHPRLRETMTAAEAEAEGNPALARWILEQVRAKEEFHPIGQVRSGYFPHLGWNERAVEAHIRRQLERLQAAGTDPDTLRRTELNLKREYQAGRLENGELTETLLEILLRENISAADFEKSGLNYRPPNVLSRGDDPLPTWDKSLNAISIYQQRNVTAYYQGMAALLSHRMIDQFEQRRPMGEDTTSWAQFLRLYVRDAQGYASLFPKAYLENEDLKLRRSPYWHFTDQAWVGRLDAIDQRLFRGRLFSDGVTGKERVTGVAQHRRIARKIAWASQLEGKAELLSLLARTKTMLYNLTQMANTAVSVGFTPFRRALSMRYLRTHVNPEWRGLDDVFRFAERHGVIESFLYDEAALPRHLRTAEVRAFMKDAADLVRAHWRKGQDVPEMKLKELWTKKYGLSDAMWKVAAWPMQASERMLRLHAFMAHYIRFREVLEANGFTHDVDDPWLIELARRGVQATQFLYNNASRPAFARTPIGKVVSRFQVWAWNSVRFQRDVYREAARLGFRRGTAEMERFQRMMTYNVLAFALASLFPASMFEATLPQPLGWMKDFAELLFGEDDEEKERAFFGMLPYPFNASQVIAPPSARLFTMWVIPLLQGDWERWASYHVWTLFPFGLQLRDMQATVKNPIRLVENTTGFPLIRLHQEVQRIREERSADDFRTTP